MLQAEQALPVNNVDKDKQYWKLRKRFVSFVGMTKIGRNCIQMPNLLMCNSNWFPGNQWRIMDASASVHVAVSFCMSAMPSPVHQWRVMDASASMHVAVSFCELHVCHAFTSIPMKSYGRKCIHLNCCGPREISGAKPVMMKCSRKKGIKFTVVLWRSQFNCSEKWRHGHTTHCNTDEIIHGDGAPDGVLTLSGVL